MLASPLMLASEAEARSHHRRWRRSVYVFGAAVVFLTLAVIVLRERQRYVSRANEKSFARLASRPSRGINRKPVSLEGKSIYFLIVDRFAKSGNSADDSTFCDWQTPHDFENGDSVDFTPHKLPGILFGPRKAYGGRCNGTLPGIVDKIEYIKGMGFDCIWISPVIKSSDYTGYFAEDFYSVDPHIGTWSDLENLIDAVHENGMCLVVDIVLNHVRQMSYVWDPLDFKADAPVAYIGPSTVYPFDKPEHYHMYGSNVYTNFQWYVMNGLPPAQVGAALGDSSVLRQHVQAGRFWCGPENPEITTCTCMPGNSGPHCPGNNPTLQVEGWFSSLADLNQSVPFVRNKLLDYVRGLRDLGIDALRLDTAIYMSKDFLADVQQAAGVDILGEATVNNLTYHASFQDNVLNGLLNFPVFYQVPRAFCQMHMEGEFGNYTLQGTFAREAPNLTKLAVVMQAQQTPGVYKNPDLLGNFLDNHDEFARIAHYCQNDKSRIMNALVWLMMSRGTPIIYYGTEQGLSGHQATVFEKNVVKTPGQKESAFPAAFTSQASVRESLWQTRYDTSSWQYRFIATLNSIRKRLETTVGEQKFHLVSDDRLVFSRISKLSGKDVWVFINNVPQDRSSEPVVYCAASLRRKQWREVIVGVIVNSVDGCFMASDSSPQILEELPRENA